MLNYQRVRMFGWITMMVRKGNRLQVALFRLCSWSVLIIIIHIWSYTWRIGYHMLLHIIHQNGYHYCMVMLPGRLEIIIIHRLETINRPGYTDDTRAFEHCSKKNSNAPTEKSLSKSQDPQILFLYHHSIIHVFFLKVLFRKAGFPICG